MDVREIFGQIDIYLFDQLLKGRLSDPGMRILDAGCGGGRNLLYFLKAGYRVAAVDRDPQQIDLLRRLAADLAPDQPGLELRVENVESMSFADSRFDAVISSAVLHFARDRQHFDSMLLEMWRVLRVGGVLFARLASKIGIEEDIRSIGDGRFLLPDGSERFLVDQDLLLKWGQKLNARQLEPIKTTNVQGLRCMTTWCLEKV